MIHFPAKQIGDLFFKNPFAVLPAATPLTNPNGRLTPELLLYHKALAQTEAALVIAGPGTVTPPKSRKASLLRVDQPKYLDGLRALTKIIFSNGAIPGLQVTHLHDADPEPFIDGTGPAEPDLTDLNEKKICTAFDNATKRAQEVGFRYVELDGANGLLLDRLICMDEHDLIEAVFKASMPTEKNPYMLALRLTTSNPHSLKYGRRFLEMGGSLLAFNEVPLRISDLSEYPLERCMINITKPFTPEDAEVWWSKVGLVGFNLDFPKPQRQIAACMVS